MNERARVAVVTGGNRGIGLEITRQLAQRGVHVVLGSRDEADGRAAGARLAAAGLPVEVRQLDVTSESSLDALAAWLKNEHGGLDILVNNAGVSLDGFNAEVARRTLDVNLFGVLRTTDRLLPLMRAGGRIVNLTSGLGDTGDLPAQLRSRLKGTANADPRAASKSGSLERAELEGLMQGFIDGVAAGTHTRDGWPSSAYRVSKMGVNAYTAILGRQLAKEGRGILASAAGPGWVQTRMGGAMAPRPVEEGADTPVWLALLPEGAPQGAVFRDRALAEW